VGGFDTLASETLRYQHGVALLLSHCDVVFPGRQVRTVAVCDVGSSEVFDVAGGDVLGRVGVQP
jgi:hypothetical protein